MVGVRRFDRERVLDGLAVTFWARGFEATSIEQLERATGLKRGSLYNAFGDKEAMFLAALDRYAERVAAPMRAALEEPDPRRGVEELLEAQMALMADPEGPGGCLAAGSCHELGGRVGPLGRRVADDTLAHEAALLAALTRWRAAGRIVEAGDLRPLARFLVALMRGLAALHKAIGDAQAVRDAARTGLAALEPWIANGGGRDPRPGGVGDERSARAVMLDHVSITVSDLRRAERFYDAVMAALGVVRVGSESGWLGYGERADAAHLDRSYLSIRSGPKPEAAPGRHWCFKAPSREAVEAFWRAGLAAGGRDEGAPGVREAYHPAYYAAFLADPDGNRIEAVCHAAEP